MSRLRKWALRWALAGWVLITPHLLALVRLDELHLRVLFAFGTLVAALNLAALCVTWQEHRKTHHVQTHV